MLLGPGVSLYVEETFPCSSACFLGLWRCAAGLCVCISLLQSSVIAHLLHAVLPGSFTTRSIGAAPGSELTFVSVKAPGAVLLCVASWLK